MWITIEMVIFITANIICFIASNKYYHLCHNPHLPYQTYPYSVKMFNFNLNTLGYVWYTKCGLQQEW